MVGEMLPLILAFLSIVVVALLGLFIAFATGKPAKQH